MSEYLHVEKPFLDQLAALGWTVVAQGYSPMQDLLTGRVRVKITELLDGAAS